MPIEVKHSVGAGPVAAAAYGGGQGQARARVKQQQLDDEARKKAQASQQAFQNEMADKDNAQALERQTAGNEQRNEFRKDAATTLATRTADQRDRDAQTSQKQEREDSPDFDYTQQQTQDLSRLDEEENTVRTDDSLTDEDRDDALRQIDSKRRQIMPTRLPKKNSPYPKGQGKGEAWVSADGRTNLTRDDKGNVKSIGDTGKPTQADENARLKILIESNKSETGKVNWDAVNKQMAIYRQGNAEEGKGEPESTAGQGKTANQDLYNDYNKLAKGGAEEPATQPAADAPAENLAYKEIDDPNTPTNDEDLLSVADAILQEDAKMAKTSTDANGETSLPPGMELADFAEAQTKLATQKMRVINQMRLRNMPAEKWVPIYNTMTEDQKQELAKFLAHV